MFQITLNGASNGSAGIPKYQQIVNFVIDAIDSKKLKIGDKIPSVNQVSETTGFAKKTVVQAFEQLKEAGILSSVQYQGYFISSSNTNSRHNIFLLFNRLTAYKEEIYESIKKSLGNNGVVDIFFHHDNPQVFDALIEQSVGKYTEYLIVPMGDPSINASIEKLPQDKIFLLDLGYKDWGLKYPSVCQYFEEDIYNCLNDYIAKIRKYRKLVLISELYLYNTRHTRKGFKRFCEENNFENEVLFSLEGIEPGAGELYIIMDDKDLVQLVKMTKALSLEIGKDLGVISYNEMPIKEIVNNGISTISTDFEKMGKDMVDMILNRKKEHLKNPCHLIDRNSF